MMTMITTMTMANAMHSLIMLYILLSVRSVHAPVLGPINVAVVVSSLGAGRNTTGYLLAGDVC